MPILILAAGRSARMGDRDKLLELVAGEPLLHRQARLALGASAKVFVALPALDHPRAAVISDLAVTLLPIPEATEGMGGTMRGAVRRLPDCAAFMILLGDLAAIELADIEAVLAAATAHPDALIWRGVTEDGRHGHPIVFSSALRPEFEALTGDSGGEPIVSPRRAETVTVPIPGNRARLDLDTPEDWTAFRNATGN